MMLEKNSLMLQTFSLEIIYIQLMTYEQRSMIESLILMTLSHMYEPLLRFRKISIVLSFKYKAHEHEMLIFHHYHRKIWSL